MSKWKITIESPPAGGEEEIIIRSDHIDERTMALIQALTSDIPESGRLTGFRNDKGICLLNPSDIYYFESVDEKVFAYGEKDVAELKFKLYELEKRFAGTDFIRVSKSMILNLSKVKRFAPYVGGRFEAVLENNEKALISRQYVPDLKKRLGLF